MGQTISLTHLAPFVDISRQKIRKEVDEELANTDITEEKKEEIIHSRLKKEIKKGVQTIQYQVLTLLTSNGQTPFVSVNMYLGEAKDERTKEDLALIIEEVLRQRIQGVKNEKGVWITPAFPKLLYVLEEDNIHEDSKYYYLTKLAAQCTAKRMVPDYISAKKMLEYKIDKNGNGNVYPCMGCTIGTEVVTYRYGGTQYTEAFWRMWDRIAMDYEIKEQSDECPYNLYIDTPSGVSIYDTKHGFVKVKRLIRNSSKEWRRVTFSNGRFATVTPDHPFETENRGVVLAKDITTDDTVLMDYKAIPSLGEVHIEPATARLKAMKVGDSNYHVPAEVFSWSRESKLAFLTSVLNSKSYYGMKDPVHMRLKFYSHEVALQFVYLLQSLDCPAGIHLKKTTHENGYVSIIYKVEFIPTEEIASTLTAKVNTTEREFLPAVAHVESIEDFGKQMYSYDVTTESEHFEFSGIYSHNCRSFLTPYVDENGNPKYYGRFNQGVVTINLPYVAMASNRDEDKFWELFDYYLEMCHRALQVKHNRLMGTVSDVAPILWQYGGLARLEKGEKIDKLLFGGYSTISLGFSGLYECVKYMTGKSHTDEEAKPFALHVMQYMNDKCKEWKAAENMDYSLYGTPMESTTSKFADALQRDFGKVEDVSDHHYITNSYHVNVREPIDAYTKLKFESEFQRLSPGGAISYIEVPNLQNNIDAVLNVMAYIYDNIMYAELNTKSDFCSCCNYDGEIQIVEDGDKLVWECPNCHNRDQRKMSVARRTCGYIGTNYWNQGRTEEIKERVLHL